MSESWIAQWLYRQSVKEDAATARNMKERKERRLNLEEMREERYSYSHITVNKKKGGSPNCYGKN